MTFHAYALPEGAPQKQVWYALCDVCRVATSGPYGNGANQQQNMKLDIEDKGWRYQLPHPMDTCPDCLILESAERGER